MDYSQQLSARMGKKNEVKIRERAFSEHRSESKRRERGGEKEREAK